MSNQNKSFFSTRRMFLAGIAASMAAPPALMVLADEQPSSEKEVLFRRGVPVGHNQAVKIAIDVTGQLKLNADGKEVRKLPMQVKGTLEYVERQLPTVPAPAKADGKTTAATIGRWARYYQTAVAKITLAEQPVEQGLREDRRLFAINNEPTAAVLFSPMGPLTREELELVDIPFGTTQLARLLPKGKVATGVGSSWKLADSDVSALLCLDNVSQHDLSVTFNEITGGEAKATLTGKVQGAVAGVSTELEITANFNYTLAQQQVTWLSATLQEDRAIGHAQPGYSAETKLKVIVETAESPVEVSDKSLGELPTVASIGTTLIDFQSIEANFTLAHDRRWRTMADSKDLAIMRMVDKGDLIAQCNISRQPPLPKGSQLTLEGFQAEIRKNLGKTFGQFVEAGQSVNDRGQRVLRVLITGMASELPIQWTYYHISDEAGNRAVIVVTLESSLVEKYPALDTQLLAGFNFTGVPETPPTKSSTAGSTSSAPAKKEGEKAEASATPRSATKPLSPTKIKSTK